jgi:hypothetical protein
VVQFVESLRYKPEGRGFDSRFINVIFHAHNPSCRTIVLKLTQSPTQIGTRNISWW